MANGLPDSFSRFAKTAAGKLRELAAGEASPKAIADHVERLEARREFSELVSLTRDAFGEQYHGRSSQQTWQRAVHNFLCRSGYYIELRETGARNTKKSFANYCAAFEAREAKTTYLVPIELVQFARPLLQFETFQIKEFSRRQLDSVLGNSVNRIFYPWAAFSPESMTLLSNYWFVEIKELDSVNKLGHFYFPADSLVWRGYAEREYTRYPKAVESVLRYLCLFDWVNSQKDKPWRTSGTGEDDSGDVWLRFRVPFVIHLTGDFLSSPSPVPALVNLATEPFQDPESGEELGEVPMRNVWLDEAQTDSFQDFILGIERIWTESTAVRAKWQFLEIAFGYLTKAYFTDPGHEQLLWNIAALEALLGEKGAGVTRRLAERFGRIAGGDFGGTKSVSKRFEKLYDLRNSLVHGAPDKPAHVTALLDAQRFSRDAFLWFLQLLHLTSSLVAGGEISRNLPMREEILTAIDLDRASRRRVSWLLDKLPEEFPHIADHDR
jgi:hypothetical protein